MSITMRTRSDENAGPTPQICPSCGAVWHFSNPMIFCGACGTEMEGAKKWGQATGERREVRRQ